MYFFSFSLSNIKKVIPKLESCITTFCQELEKKQGAFDILHMCSRLMLDAITIGMFDVDFHALTPGSEGDKLLHEFDISIAEFGRARPFNPFRKYMFWDPDMKRAYQAVDYIQQVCRNILNKYRSSKSLEEKENDTSILGHLVRCPYENDDKRCADMQSFIFAGHDTSSITIAWTLIEVLKHPYVLTNLRNELDEVHPKWDKPFDAVKLSKLPYLQMVINESMRLRPVAAGGQSRVAEIDIEVATISRR